MALLGTAMVVGMLGGFFANAGLSASELKEKCGEAQDLMKEINEVSKWYGKMKNGYEMNETELRQIINDSKQQVDKMNSKILQFKERNKKILDRESYIIMSTLITITIIFIVKFIITKIYK